MPREFALIAGILSWAQVTSSIRSAVAFRSNSWANIASGGPNGRYFKITCRVAKRSRVTISFCSCCAQRSDTVRPSVGAMVLQRFNRSIARLRSLDESPLLMKCSAIALVDSKYPCLLYTSDAADDLLCVDLGGRRIIKKK